MTMLKVVLMMGVVFCFPLYSCQVPRTIEPRQATDQDAHGILNLINIHAIKENDKIVVLPESFRLQALQNGIREGRYFVAYDTVTKQIVAYKKLFLLDDAQERAKVFEEELRLQGNKSQEVDAISFLCSQAGYATVPATIPSIIPTPEQCVYLYTGGDFTHPDYRYKGINSQLTDYALSAMKSTVCEQLLKNKIHQVALVYGLTHLNDYNEQGQGSSRTPGLVQSFASFIRKLQSTKNISTVQILHQRFKSYMPTFDLHATECVPLSDDKAVGGYGHILLSNSVTLSELSQ
jgi:hypothetical protein